MDEAIIGIAAFLLLVAMVWRRKKRIRASRLAGGLEFAGRYWTWQELTRHWLFLGGTGRGKTFASDILIRNFMAAGCSMILTCVKVDDYQRIARLAKEAGQSHRLVEVCPTGPWKMNLLESLLDPHRSPATASQFLTKIGEVGVRGGTGGTEPFWATQSERALNAAITLCMLVVGKVSIPDVHAVVTTGPDSLTAVRNSEWDADSDYEINPKTGEQQPIVRRRCAQLVVDGYRMKLDETSPAFNTAVAYLLNEMPSGGDRMRGGILANVNNTLGRFLDEPFLTALNTETTLNAKMIDEHNLIAVLNYPVMEYHTPARMFQFAWTLDAELHCMRRKYVKESPPFVCVRDEVGWIMGGDDWEAKVALVARSQGLAFVDLIQDLDTLLMALGGQSATNTAHSFISNHAHKLLFGGDNEATNKHASELTGMHKELSFSGGGGHQPTGDIIDDALGVSSHIHWNESYQPVFRKEWYARLPVGVGVLLSEGIHRVVDFRTKRR